MAEDRAERRLAAIFTADVVGYSRLVRANEEDALAAVGALISDVIQRAVAEHRGRIFKKMGDAVLAEFGSTVDAVRCAIAVQHEIAARGAGTAPERRIAFRIGVHVGDVVADGEDIHGDGVNVAARIEGLATANGICISEDVFRQVVGRIEAGFEDIGPQRLKNIDSPIRVYRVRPDAAQQGRVVTPLATRLRRLKWPAATFVAFIVALVVARQFGVFPIREAPPDFDPASIERMAHPLPEKPSIAVLPFANMSDDPAQEYFVDGMTEDLITDLSKISGLFVIARNSSFSYKGQAVQVRQVAEELGVRYVLEGSVRRAGDQVRINAQLIDATTGGHIWAERYDGTMADVFALQDRVTNKLVSALAIALDQGENAARAIQDTENPRAYDAFLQGRAHYRRWNIDAFGQAVPFFKQALALDPDYAQAHAALAAIYWQSWRRWGERGKPWPPGMGVKVENYYQALDLAKAHLEKAMRRPTPLAHQVAARMHLKGRRYEAAITEAERAVALDPGDANAQATLAYVLVFGGQAEEAAAVIARAMRLDPHYPPNYLGISGIVAFALGDLAGAAELLARRYQRNPEDQELVPMQVSALMQIGREAEARRLFDDYEGMKHTITPRYPYWPFKDLDVFERFAQGWVAAGACCRRELEDLLKELRAKTQAQQ